MLDAFRPTWRRTAAAAVVAGAAFLLPQEAPLAYYPLNHPSDVYYLEITCAASVESETRIYFDTGNSFNELECIRWPIAPSSQPYTYTFPLWDAPLCTIRVEPLRRAGELLVTNMRIYTRSGREIKRFVRDDFDATHELAGIFPTPDGWKFVTTPTATHPFSHCGFFPPIIPAGMNVRNLQRCLLSWSYLALMLWILLLAVYFAARWPAAEDKDGEWKMENGRWRSAAPHPPSLPTPSVASPLPPPLPRPKAGWRCIVRDALFLALLALLFSTVGNRGLIKDFIHHARFPVQPVEPGLRLEFDLKVDRPTTAQLFWDTGHGFNEAESQRRDYEAQPDRQTLRFDLPPLPSIKALRFDPLSAEGRLDIRGIRIVDHGRRTRLVLPLDCLQADHQIATVAVGETATVITTTPGAGDPILQFTPAATAAINRLLQDEPLPSPRR
jgi:hypothetical protein